MTPSKDAPQQTSEREELTKQAENKVIVAEKKDKQPEAVPKQKGKKDKAKGKVTISVVFLDDDIDTVLLLKTIFWVKLNWLQLISLCCYTITEPPYIMMSEKKSSW